MGPLVGRHDGPAVGDADGSAVGAAVARSLGAGLGPALGAAVRVGATEGAPLVGTRVVGGHVGGCVCCSSLPGKTLTSKNTPAPVMRAVANIAARKLS